MRVTKRSEDEVGVLLDNVNELLHRMEERDQHYRGEGDRLESEVQMRTRELRESNQRQEEATAQAVAANNAKGQFIANMTHEIRTPMNGVLGMTELLFNTDLTQRQHKFTRTILESAEDLLSIINNILDFSKVEAGKLEKVDSRPFSPKECVEKVSDLLVGRAQLDGLGLSVECADDVPEAMLGDGKRLRQVLTNIIGNAIKFTEQGNIVARVSVAESSDQQATIRFEVVDTGIGIPRHLHEHVFEGFSQADTSTTRQFGGTGLGLAISKHLVELMGGEIGVISRPGVGSNFWFTVVAELCLAPTAAELDLGGVRALIVATTGGSRDHLRHVLVTCGGAAVGVPNAEQALHALEADTFDVALLDTQSLDALALAREIRADEKTKSLPLVLVSTVERPVAELKQAGIDGSLSKPCTQRELFSCVAKVTGRLSVVVSTDDREDLESDAWGASLRDRAQGRQFEAAVYRTRFPGHTFVLCRLAQLILLARLDRRVIPKLLETPGLVVPLHEVGHGGADGLEVLKDSAVDRLLLERTIPPLRHTVRFRFLDKAEAGVDPPIPDLLEEVV